jgi:hypothetical protein
MGGNPNLLVFISRSLSQATWRERSSGCESAAAVSSCIRKKIAASSGPRSVFNFAGSVWEMNSLNSKAQSGCSAMTQLYWRACGGSV